MSDNIVAYHLLKNTNLIQSKEQLIKATIIDLRHNLMKEQLKKNSVTSHLPVPIRSHYQGRSQWKQKKEINLNVIQIQILKNASTQRVAIAKTVASVNLLNILKRKPTNLNYIRGSPKAENQLILKAI